jgi:hypothetical protein
MSGRSGSIDPEREPQADGANRMPEEHATTERPAVQIADLGRGPQIEGYRLTVMDVFYYLHRGYEFDFIHQAMSGRAYFVRGSLVAPPS